MARRPRWLSPDLLLLLGVLGFAAALVLLVTRGEAPAEGPRPGARAVAGATAAGAPEASGPAARGTAEPAGGAADAPGATSTPGSFEPEADLDRATAATQAASPPAGPTPEPPGEPDPRDELPRLGIRGRVLEPGGQPVSGMTITARPLDRHAGRLGPVRKVRSQADGQFAFEDLLPGRYRLETPETTQHRPTRQVTPAGTEGVDLVLVGLPDLRAFGRVTDDRGDPLAGVEVRPFGQDVLAVSDAAGRYDLRFHAVRGVASVMLRFRAEGYKDHEVRVAQTLLAGGGTRQDATLEPEEVRFRVRGRLTAERGRLPAGVAVKLRSAQRRATHDAAADSRGDFEIEGVQESRDWQLSVHPVRGFGDAQLGPLHLYPGSGPLEVLVPSLESGTLVGRLVDPEGRPLPNLALTVASEEARSQSRRLLSDDRGEFRVEDVPSGSLRIETQAMPLLRVTGLALDPGQRKDVELVLDMGREALAGRVLDALGDPVPGAEVRLDWQQAHRGARSSSFRRTVSDSDGAFRFRQLGPGPHGLSVRATGHRAWRARVAAEDAHGGVEVRLQPTP